MEKKELYVTPAVRFLDLRFEGTFLVSATGTIDDWTEDDDDINF